MTEIIVAIITGVGSIVAVILTNNKNNDKIQNNLKINQAVTDTKIDELTREVRRHNDFAIRIPVIEEQIKTINEKTKNLEEYHK